MQPLDFPNLHSALRAAIDDTKKIANDDRYAIVMGTWHEPRGDDTCFAVRDAFAAKPTAVCAVCMAGAVLASHGLDPKVEVEFEYGDSKDYDAIKGLDVRTSKIVEAIDALRCGEVDRAYELFYGVPLPEGIDDYFESFLYGEDEFYPSLERLHDYLVAKGI